MMPLRAIITPCAAAADIMFIDATRCRRARGALRRYAMTPLDAAAARYCCRRYAYFADTPAAWPRMITPRCCCFAAIRR